MTRHTHNRQRRLIAEMTTGLNHEFFMHDKNLPISRYRNALMGRELDPTFKWVRTKRANFIYNEDADMTVYYVYKNVISWTSIKPNGVFRTNMNPKVGRSMTYRIGHTL